MFFSGSELDDSVDDEDYVPEIPSTTTAGPTTSATVEDNGQATYPLASTTTAGPTTSVTVEDNGQATYPVASTTTAGPTTSVTVEVNGQATYPVASTSTAGPTTSVTVEENAASSDDSTEDGPLEMHTPKRLKRPLPQTWKQHQAQTKRLSGETYTNRAGNEKAARRMGNPCTSTFCQKSKLRQCQTIAEQTREWIFYHFWSMSTWTERQTYIKALVTKVDVKQKKSTQDSRRSLSYCYVLKPADGTAVAVCKKLFAATFGVAERTVTSWLKDETDAPEIGTRTPKTGKEKS